MNSNRTISSQLTHIAGAIDKTASKLTQASSQKSSENYKKKTRSTAIEI